jgi:hypothetical protein
MSKGSGPKIRNIEIADREAGKYLNKLEGFLGTQNVERRIKKDKRALEIETGLIYKDFWLNRRLEWWLGLRDIRRLRGCFENQAVLLAKRLTMSRIIASFSSVSLVCTLRS